jgi:hypothetical protein
MSTPIDDAVEKNYDDSDFIQQPECDGFIDDPIDDDGGTIAEPLCQGCHPFWEDSLWEDSLNEQDPNNLHKCACGHLGNASFGCVECKC